MTILNPHYMRITPAGGSALTLATVAIGLESVDGYDQVPGGRVGLYEVAYRHGAFIDYDHWKEPRQQRFRAYISPYDADGAVTHANGTAGHRRENLEALAAALASPSRPITVEKLIPHPTTPTATQTLEAEAICPGGLEVAGTQLRRAAFTLIHPYPFWHLTPAVGPVAVPASIDLSDATAPINDMVFVFTGDGRVTYTNPAYGRTSTQYIEISGSAGATVTVDVGARTVKEGSSLRYNWLLYNNPRWMEWAPGGTINLTTTGSVTVTYNLAKIT